MGNKEREQPSSQSPEQSVMAVIEQNRGPETSKPEAEVLDKEKGETPKKEPNREEKINTVMGEKPAKTLPGEEAEAKQSVPGLAPSPEDAKELERADASKVSGAVETQKGLSDTLSRPAE